MQTARIWILFAIATLLFACVKTGSVAERKPLAAVPPSGKTVNVVVKNPEPEWQRDADALRQGLLKQFAERKWWAQSDQADVVIEVTLTDFDKGNKAAQMFAGAGEAELKADVVFKGSDGAVLADLAVTGNSKRQSRTTIGGFDTSWADSLPGRAVRATVDQICEYIEAKNKR